MAPSTGRSAGTSSSKAPVTRRRRTASTSRSAAAPGQGAGPSAAFLGVFARPDEPAPARARDLPARGIWGAGPGAIGPGRVELRPLRGSHLKTDRGGPPELVALEGWRSGR